jgi:hypothetical protein
LVTHPVSWRTSIAGFEEQSTSDFRLLRASRLLGRPSGLVGRCPLSTTIRDNRMDRPVYSIIHGPRRFAVSRSRRGMHFLIMEPSLRTPNRCSSRPLQISHSCTLGIQSADGRKARCLRVVCPVSKRSMIQDQHRSQHQVPKRMLAPSSLSRMVLARSQAGPKCN